MAEKEEALKPVSYRIDDETKEQIKKISEELGLGQHGTLQKLVEAFQIQKGKTGITDSNAQTLFNKFENLTSQMNQSYLSIIQELQTANENARLTVSHELDSKDFTIQESNEKIKNQKELLTVAEQLKIEAIEKAKKLSEENTSQQKQIEVLLNEIETAKNDFSEKLTDKENLNKILTNSYNELKSKVEDMEAEYQELINKSKQLNIVIVERDSLAKDKLELSNKLQDQIKHESESLENQKQRFDVVQEKSILELERKYQEQINKLQVDHQKDISNYQEQVAKIKEDKQKEIDKYQQKYFELLEQINNKDTEIK